MDAVFVRHKMGDSTPEILNELWSKKLIAIHFGNNWSIEPKDYDSAGKKALTTLGKCCEFGAYVGADFREICPKTMLVGKIERGSKIEPKKFDDFVYKVVQLKNCREISYLDYPLLEAIQPRQVTISNWPSAKKHLESILENKKLSFEVQSLAPSQLEVICYEYLRMKGIIEALLLPIGRNLKDVDILGINSNGEKIWAQVTYNKNSAEILSKIERLKNYGSKDSQLIFFGTKSQIELQKLIDNNVNYISVEDVFESLASNRNSVYHKMICSMLNW